MNIDLLRSINKHTDTLNEQTKIKPQQTLEYIMNKQMECSSLNPPITLAEEGKWLILVTSVQTTISVFIITGENNNFSISTPGH